MAIFAYRWFEGGVQKFTYLFLKFFSKIKIFEIFFIIRNINEKIEPINNINFNIIEGNGKILTDNLIKVLIKRNEIIINFIKEARANDIPISSSEVIFKAIEVIPDFNNKTYDS